MYSPPTNEANPWAVGLSRWFAINLLVAVIVAMLAFRPRRRRQRAIMLEIDDVIGPAIADYVVARTANR